MIKTGVVYATKTKHSKKLAEAIGAALKTKAENIATNPVLQGIDLLFVVGGIYGGESLPEMLDYMKGLDGSEIKNAALVTSCASMKNRQDSVRRILMEKEINVLDEHLCPGSFLFFRFGHPNKKDVQQAVDFAVELLKQQQI
jgi:flavodoxin